MNVKALNALPWQDAKSWFTQTCAAQRWATMMTDDRPYKNEEEILSHANRVWSRMDKNDYLEAFTAHPMIGDLDSLRSKFANTRTLAAGEQSGTAEASEATLLALREKNLAYREKHGFIFIICATGLSAETMLKALETRLSNTTAQEMENAAAEQIKITCLRISKAMNSEG